MTTSPATDATAVPTRTAGASRSASPCSSRSGSSRRRRSGTSTTPRPRRPSTPFIDSAGDHRPHHGARQHPRHLRPAPGRAPERPDPQQVGPPHALHRHRRADRGAALRADPAMRRPSRSSSRSSCCSRFTANTFKPLTRGAHRRQPVGAAPQQGQRLRALRLRDRGHRRGAAVRPDRRGRRPGQRPARLPHLRGHHGGLLRDRARSRSRSRRPRPTAACSPRMPWRRASSRASARPSRTSSPRRTAAGSSPSSRSSSSGERGRASARCSRSTARTTSASTAVTPGRSRSSAPSPSSSCVVPVAILSDRFGRRLMMRLGVVVLIIGALIGFIFNDSEVATIVAITGRRDRVHRIRGQRDCRPVEPRAHPPAPRRVHRHSSRSRRRSAPRSARPRSERWST